MNKLLLLVGAGIGYVLGARAGRERYDQIADQANKLWTDPRVQTKVEEAKAKAPEVAHLVGEEVKAKVDEVKAKVTGESEPASPLDHQPGDLATDTSTDTTTATTTDTQVTSTTYDPTGSSSRDLP